MKAAIQAVHKAGVLHGDLHVGNFVGSDPCDVKLIDFASASSSGVPLRLLEQEEERFGSNMSQVSLLPLTWLATFGFTSWNPQ